MLGGLGVRGGDIEGFTPTPVDDESPEEGDVGDAGPETTDSPVPDDPGGDDEV